MVVSPVAGSGEVVSPNCGTETGFPGSTDVGEVVAELTGSTTGFVVVVVGFAGGLFVAVGVTEGGVEPGSALDVLVTIGSGDVTGAEVEEVPNPPRPAAYKKLH